MGIPMGLSVENYRIASQIEVLRDMQEEVGDLMRNHVQSRRLWMPHELMPNPQDIDARTELQKRARGMPDTVRVSLALNLLTEEGLPHFHRLLSHYLGDDGSWGQWNNLWTAEEDRHGCVLRDYVRESGVLHLPALEELQFEYLQAGFSPGWGEDLYSILAYTSLQERATQRAHANTGRLAAVYDPTLQKLLAKICGDEARHYAFYRQAFALLLERDPERALLTLANIAPALAMPGHRMPGYQEMAEVIRRSDIYGPRHYAKLLSELLEFWDLAGLSLLTAQAEKARERLLALPEKLNRVAEFRERKDKSQRYQFQFLCNRSIELNGLAAG